MKGCSSRACARAACLRAPGDRLRRGQAGRRRRAGGQGRSRRAPTRPGWQKLANRIDAPVYCPGWLPDPLTGQIGGRWNNINSVSPRPQLPRELRLAGDRAAALPAASCTSTSAPTRVATKIPTCRTGGSDSRNVPCFADAARARHGERDHARRSTRSTRTPTRGTACCSGAATAPLHAVRARRAAAHVPARRAVPEARARARSSCIQPSNATDEADAAAGGRRRGGRRRRRGRRSTSSSTSWPAARRSAPAAAAPLPEQHLLDGIRVVQLGRDRGARAAAPPRGRDGAR